MIGCRHRKLCTRQGLPTSLKLRVSSRLTSQIARFVQSWLSFITDVSVLFVDRGEVLPVGWETIALTVKRLF